MADAELMSAPAGERKNLRDLIRGALEELPEGQDGAFRLRARIGQDGRVRFVVYTDSRDGETGDFEFVNGNAVVACKGTYLDDSTS